MASARPKTPNQQAAERGASLRAWMRERPEHQGLTATEIVDASGIYAGHGRYDVCLADLKAMCRRGEVERSLGRPARWTALV